MKPWLPEYSDTLRILVIDGDYNVVQLLLNLLAPLRFDCHYALDSTSGWEECERVVPHLVLLDLSLPDGSGRDILLRIRQASYLPVIALGGAEDLEAGLGAYNAGADEFVVKPFDARIMVARVVAHLRRSYQYSKAELLPQQEPEEPVAQPTQVPSGWAFCDMCRYMGPYQKFEHEDPLGKRILLCPNCREDRQIVFSLA